MSNLLENMSFISNASAIPVADHPPPIIPPPINGLLLPTSTFPTEYSLYAESNELLTSPKSFTPCAVFSADNLLGPEAFKPPLTLPPFMPTLLRSSIEKSELPQEEIKNSPNIIHNFKEDLIKYNLEVKRLGFLHSRLSAVTNSLDENKWTQELNQIEKQMVLVTSCEETLKSYSLEILKTQLHQRSKKRMRQRNKMIAHKKMKKKLLSENHIQHALIDLWQNKNYERIEKTERDKQIQLEADSVLSGVRNKKSEAHAMLTLLSNLVKLRNLRIQNRKCKGEHVSPEAADAFSGIIDKLKSQWINQIRDYNTEEQGLKVMLEKSMPDRPDIIEKQRSQKLWLQIMFGENFFNDPLDMGDATKLREQWDSYIINSEEDGYYIPNGWILPAPPSSSDWSSFSESKFY